MTIKKKDKKTKAKTVERQPRQTTELHWADEFAQEIISSGKHQPYWVDDMKTPSGKIHVGSLRGVFTHDVIYKSLLSNEKQANFSYVIDDHDPMDALPIYIERGKYEEHLGKPLNRIPSPEPGFRSYAEYFAKDFIEVFNACGAHPKIIWASELYTSGKMNELIKLCLDKAHLIRGIYKKIYGKSQPKDWYPFNVICERCGKLSTTAATSWDGETVTYECRENAVDWTEGCGFKGKISPYNGNGKLPWKIDWACKWKVIGVTVEGAGKDHMTAGGSHDIAKEICRKVINFKVPFAFAHEHFLFGGRKMSSSKGVGSSARDIFTLLPPELIRFLMLRPHYNKAIDFDPGGMTIPDLFDEYDHAAQAFWEKNDKRLARAFELSQVGEFPRRKQYLPRFRDIALHIQYPEISVQSKCQEEKASELNLWETQGLEERVKYAKIWLDGYAPEQYIFTPSRETPQAVKTLSTEQKEFLGHVSQMLAGKWESPEALQQKLYEKTKEVGIPANQAFSAIYLSLIGKPHGPRAAWLLLKYREISKQRFETLAKGDRN